MGRASQKHIFILASAVSALSACGTTTTSTAPDINIEMLGVFDPPSTAKGTVTPLSQEYKVEAINLTDSTGKVTNILTTAASFKIVNRPQIILSASMSDYKDLSFAKVSVQFNAALKTTTRTSQDIASTLEKPVAEIDKVFTVESTSSIHVIVKAKWGNTVTKDDASGVETPGEPSFEVKVE